MEYAFSCDIFYTFNIVLGEKGDGRSSIRENKWKIEKHSTKCWMSQVILVVIVVSLKEAIENSLEIWLWNFH